MIIEKALYIVATPIGNLNDMSRRAIDVLKACDHIAAEDTRHSARLLQHFDIHTRTEAYHDFSSSQQSQNLLDRVLAGASIALISDAGTPLISDPGYRLVKLARDQGVKVFAIPGPCALVAALSIAGLPSNKFIFEGFVPAKQTARKQAFMQTEKETRTSVYYESPHRIVDSIKDLLLVCGEFRQIALVRELTKTFETAITGTVAEVLDSLLTDINQQRGEMVLIVKGLERLDSSEVSDEAQHMMSVLLTELPLKTAASLVAKTMNLKKNALYQWGLEQQKKAEI